MVYKTAEQSPWQLDPSQNGPGEGPSPGALWVGAQGWGSPVGTGLEGTGLWRPTTTKGPINAISPGHAWPAIDFQGCC